MNDQEEICFLKYIFFLISADQRNITITNKQKQNKINKQTNKNEFRR